MKPKKLKEWIDSLTQDITFMYNGVPGSICPFNRQDIAVAYGDNTKNYTNIDDVMSDPFFNGKSLNEISDQLDI